jgi:hypothetical protein
MSNEVPYLPDRMIALADKGGPRAAQLRDLAAKLNAAAKGFYGSPQTHTVQQFLGAYARARRLWCDVTGEPLVG